MLFFCLFLIFFSSLAWLIVLYLWNQQRDLDSIQERLDALEKVRKNKFKVIREEHKMRAAFLLKPKDHK